MKSAKKGGSVISGEADQPVRAIPFPHLVLPPTPMTISHADYSIFTPAKGSFWPCVGMHCPATPGKNWVVVNPASSRSPFTAGAGSESNPWLHEDNKTEAEPSNMESNAKEGAKDETSETLASADADYAEMTRLLKELESRERRRLVWALFVEPVPEEYKQIQPFGNLFQLEPLETDQYVVTHMRRGYVCPETGNLEIARLEPGNEKYRMKLVWPKREPKTSSIAHVDEGEGDSAAVDVVLGAGDTGVATPGATPASTASESDSSPSIATATTKRKKAPSIVPSTSSSTTQISDSATSPPPTTTPAIHQKPTPTTTDTASKDREQHSLGNLERFASFFDTSTIPEWEALLDPNREGLNDSASQSSSTTMSSSPSSSSDNVPEDQLDWKIEPRLQHAFEKIKDVLSDAIAINSPQIETIIKSVNWTANTAYQVSAELDRIAWLLNDVPGIGAQYTKMIEATDIMWRARFTSVILKTRFVADRYGYTTSEKKKHMESFLAGLSESSSRNETRLMLERYRQQAQALPESIRHEVLQQINRIQQSGSAELSSTKRILDFIFELPWNNASKDTFDMKRAREILDKKHYGMDDVKERVLELLAVNQLTGKFAKGKVLALLGPPGTGKTTIASSIAASLDRTFGQISIGGLWDISDLKGHRRTYLASMAGQLLRTINLCKTNNPVILLDEIDKLAPGSQVATALLEILDPSQQSSFTDTWIDLPFDISNVLFICTANWGESIHPALRDRLEVVELEGYLEHEKFEIAKRHLLPKCMEKAGLTEEQLSMSDGAIKAVVKHYSPLSPGVRDLESQLQAIVNVCSLDIARGNASSFNLTVKNYEQFLSRSEFHRYEHEKSPSAPGCASALTQLGVQQIEVLTWTSADSIGSYHITGNLDDVMKESTQLAFTYLTNAIRNAPSLPPDVANFFSTKSVHIHLPRGGQSKKGVHAGACIALSLLSLALGKSVPTGWAISGELSLLGKLLPITHMKRMVHAAQLHKIKKIILPQDNRQHWDELPETLKDGIQVYFVSWFYEIAELIFKVELPKVTNPVRSSSPPSPTTTAGSKQTQLSTSSKAPPPSTSSSSEPKVTKSATRSKKTSTVPGTTSTPTTPNSSIGGGGGRTRRSIPNPSTSL
jgi:endopeptidase La